MDTLYQICEFQHHSVDDIVRCNQLSVVAGKNVAIEIAQKFGHKFERFNPEPFRKNSISSISYTILPIYLK